MTYPSLCIDIGNSFYKLAFFAEDHQMLQKEVFQDEDELFKYLKYFSFKNAIVCSVRNGVEDFISKLKPENKVYLFGNELNLPVSNAYKTPQTLGKDRLASAIGASFLFPDQDCLVIDAGTCITYDFITKEKEYLGGAISPGMKMRFQALNHFTSKLPLIEPNGEPELVGVDTTTSIQSGVINGMRFEIEKAIETYSQNYPDLQVIVCGGDAQFFESIIKGVIFAFPDLVLFGLNHTLHHNAIS